MELNRSKPRLGGAFPQNTAASQTLGRGLDVLEQVAAGPAPLGVIATRLGLSRTTVHRLAASLLERRYLNLAPRRGYSLGPKLLELGGMAREQIDLIRIARPAMEKLAEETGDAVLLTIRDGDAAVLVDYVAASRRLAPRLRIGERAPVVAAAAGAALLIDMSADERLALWARLASGDAATFVGRVASAARSGLVVDAAVADPDIAALAAPIRGADGTIRGALSVAMAATYAGDGLSSAAQSALLRAAAALSQELGWKTAPMHGGLADGDAERELLRADRPVRQARRTRAGSPGAARATDEGDVVKGQDA